MKKNNQSNIIIGWSNCQKVISKSYVNYKSKKYFGLIYNLTYTERTKTKNPFKNNR